MSEKLAEFHPHGKDRPPPDAATGRLPKMARKLSLSENSVDIVIC